MSQVAREQRLEQAYAAKSNAELRALYDAWAAQYDQDLQAFGYSYPPAIAGLVGRYVREREAPILDAGAGTGIVGEVLSILGYTRLTGIALSLSERGAEEPDVGRAARVRGSCVCCRGLGRRPAHGSRAAVLPG